MKAQVSFPTTDLRLLPNTLVFFFLLSGMTFIGSAGSSNVERWRPQDFAFQSSAPGIDNPFHGSFTATAEGPAGISFETLGFFDGDNTWKIRFAPTKAGIWTLTTRSDLPDLDGKTIEFECVENTNPNVHGGLRVDPDHPRHFVYEDGTRYYPMGYECDWLWALDMGNEGLPTLLPFLDKLAGSGFNYLILNGYAHDTSWRKGKTEERDYGPPPLFPWGGSNEKPDHSRFNLDYWRHYDRVIEALYERGMTAHLMIKVYNKKVKWPKRNSAEDDLYFKWLVARYAAYPNVLWDFSKESYNEKDQGYKIDRLQLVRESDPYDRLTTLHDDKDYDTGAYDEVADFHADQNHKDWRKRILSQRKRREWPVVNVEFGYEHGIGGPEDKTYGQAQPPEEVARRAWEICMAGGYIAYYYTNTAWDVIHPDETPPGYAYMKNLGEFFESTRYWLMEPVDKIVDGGYCLAGDGEIVVYLPSNDPVSIDLSGQSSDLRGEWFHPFTGDREEEGDFAPGEQEITPPADWGDGPFVLRLRTRE